VACEAAPDDVDEELWGIAVRGYACGLLASSYEHGFGVERDFERAFELNERGCSAGWARSCAQQGYFLERGMRAAEHPDEEAAQFYEEACDQEDPMGCHRLGVLLLEGRGVDRDPELAREFLTKACDADDPEACQRLEETDD
jgi:TPR repeat protein